MTDIVEVTEKSVATAAALPAQSPMAMMLSAVQQGASLEQVAQMMDLQERWEKAEAKKAYDAAFSAFKAESVSIYKRGTGHNSRTYARLIDVVSAVTQALSKHGLSSSWKLTKDEPNWIEVTCFLRHIGGHEESVSMGGPPDTSGSKNAIQSRASAKTYLERYTLKAITGLSEEDDDNDGASEDELNTWRAMAHSAATLEELTGIRKDGTEAFNKAKDVMGFQDFMRICNGRAKELKNAA